MGYGTHGVRVYVAGPLASSGESAENLHRAALAARELMERGCEPFVPHSSWILAAAAPGPSRERWLRWCLAWLAECHVLLRLPGESEGADREVEEARRLGIPVAGSVEEAARLAGWRARAPARFVSQSGGRYRVHGRRVGADGVIEYFEEL